MAERYVPRLLTKYRSEIAPALLKEFSYSNPMQVPRVEKININAGLGMALQNPKIIEEAVKQLTMIAGQKAVIAKAKKSVANFRLREGQAIGVTVTLRRAQMYDFLDRFVNIALPRVRDFRGISPKAFDGRGNYTCGIREHIIFPEIDYNSVEKIYGFNITIVTSAKTNDEGRALLKGFGMPFRQ